MARAVIINVNGQDSVNGVVDETLAAGAWDPGAPGANANYFPAIYTEDFTPTGTTGFFIGHWPDGAGGIYSAVKVNRGLIGNWDITDVDLWNLASGTPTVSPVDGVVFSAIQGQARLQVYEDANERVRVGWLSAGVFGLKVYDSGGVNVIFEASDTQQKMAAWDFDQTYLYSLVSGTPTSSPSDGIVLEGGATARTIVYENTEKRVEVGYLAAGIYGIKAYNNDGTTVNFELSDTRIRIADFDFDNTYLYSLVSGTPTSSPSDGIVLEGGSTARVITYENTEKRVEVGYLAAGIYGIRAYADNGTTVVFEVSDTEITAAGWEFDSTTFRSAAVGSARIEMDKTLQRISVMDSGNAYVVSMGYLDALPHGTAFGTATSGSASLLTDTGAAFPVDDAGVGMLVNLEVNITAGTGSPQTRTITINTATTISASFSPAIDGTSVYNVSYTAADYGFWAKQGDRIRIDGEVQSQGGDWLIGHDQSFLILDGSGNTIIRLGTDTGDKGLFIYDTAGVQLAKLISNEIFVGSATKFFKFNASSGEISWTGVNTSLTEAGAFTATSATITGTITATDGAIANWTIATDSLTSTNIGMHSAGYTEGAEIILGHATLYASAKIGLKADGSGKIADGNFSWDIAGNVTGAGTWTNTATITGGVFQTAGSGSQRVVVTSASNQLQFYNAANDLLCSLGEDILGTGDDGILVGSKSLVYAWHNANESFQTVRASLHGMTRDLWGVNTDNRAIYGRYFYDANTAVTGGYGAGVYGVWEILGDYLSNRDIGPDAYGVYARFAPVIISSTWTIKGVVAALYADALKPPGLIGQVWAGYFRGDAGAGNVFIQDKLGIGAAIPAVELHVQGSANLVDIMVESTGANSNPRYLLKNDARQWNILVHGGGGDAFRIYDNTAAAYRMTIDASGNVGIGDVVNPVDMLHIQALGGADITLENTGSAATLWSGDADRSGAGQGLMALQGKWNGTRVAMVNMISGADTVNKDDGHITFETASAGTTVERMKIFSTGGVTIGSPTGGDKGIGTLNAKAIYDDGVILADHVFDAALGEKNRFDPQNFNLDWYSQYWQQNRHLASIPSWTKDNQPSLGELSHQILETIEVQAVLIEQLNARIKALETT